MVQKCFRLRLIDSLIIIFQSVTGKNVSCCRKYDFQIEVGDVIIDKTEYEGGACILPLF